MSPVSQVGPVGMRRTPLSVRAAAKINLHLGVGAPREDGFHPLSTVYQAISLYDDLTVAPAEQWTLEVTGASWVRTAEIGEPAENIVTRAAQRLLGRVPEVSVALHKSIPVAGGMAGGSADAAAALVALDRLHDLRTSDERLLELAGELGSDVPFALLGGTALGEGRGEQVAPVRDEGSWWWVVVPSEQGLSTPEVYRHFDRLRPSAPAEPRSANRLLAALADPTPERLAAALHNDLEEPALDLRPDLARLLDRGVAEGALRGLVSGSGPTCLFLCRDSAEAREVAGALHGADHPVTLVAHGAVAGAHVLRAREEA